MRRRDIFGSIALGGFAALAGAEIARGQRGPRIWRIGVIMGLAPRDAEALLRVRAFESSWSQLGWVEGRNVSVDYRWVPGDVGVYRTQAEALVATAPDVILASGTSILAAVRAATNAIPIVFVGVSDPEGTGVVASISRPGGNITGFANFEPTMGGKWIEALKEMAPFLTRVGVLRTAGTFERFLKHIVTVGPNFGVETIDCAVRNIDEIERAIGGLSDQRGVGLMVLPDPILTSPRRLIIDLAARYRMPAIYPFRYYVDDGGLISYGVDIPDQVRRAAFYIDRILKGDKPANLPVQAPTKYELVINLRTAKALSLSVPPSLLARADEVIE